MITLNIAACINWWLCYLPGHLLPVQCVTQSWLPAGHLGKHSLRGSTFYKDLNSEREPDQTLSFVLCPSPPGSCNPNLSSICCYHCSPVSYLTAPDSGFLLLSIPHLHSLWWELPALEVPWACFPQGPLLFHIVQLWWKLLSPCTARGLWDHTRLPVNICRETSGKLELGKCFQNQHLDQSTWKKLSSKNPQLQRILDTKLAQHHH